MGRMVSWVGVLGKAERFLVRVQIISLPLLNEKVYRLRACFFTGRMPVRL
jgi:hypothetical protein